MPVTSVARSRATALFLLCFGAYAWFYQAGGWNANSRFDLTRAIVERGTISVDAYRHNTGDLSLRNGHYYCDKAPGLSWLCVPPVAAAQLLFGPPDSPESLGRRAWAATLFAVGIPSAIAAVLLMFLLGHLGFGPALSAAGATAWALASLAFPYATLLYGHQLAAALIVAAFWLLVRARNAAESGAATLASFFCAGLLLGSAIVVEYPAVLAAVVLGVYAIATARPRSAVLWMIAGAIIPGIALAAYDIAAFGGPFITGYAFSTQKSRHIGGMMGIGAPSGVAFVNILFTQYRGMFYSMPWLLLGIPGAVRLLRSRETRAEAGACAAVFIAFVALNVSLTDWQGGWAMGARYVVPALPFAAILAAGALLPMAGAGAHRALVSLFALLAAFAFVMMLVGTAVKPEVPQWIDRPFTLLFRTFVSENRVAINSQSVDEYDTKGGHRRAWNVGEKLGMRGRASLVPLLLWMSATGAWLVAATRRSSLNPEPRSS